MPRNALPGLANSPYFKTDLDIEGVWSLACFVMKKSHRGRGLTTVLTRAATEFVREQGGTIVEALPMGHDRDQGRVHHLHPKASTFRCLAFEVVQRRAAHKPKIRIAVNDNEQIRPNHREDAVGRFGEHQSLHSPRRARASAGHWRIPSETPPTC
jgi:hypothetical protein